MPRKKLPVKKALANGERRGKSCFMCENIDKNMYHMFSTVFIGNSQTYVIGGELVTPRGYRDV